MNRDRDLNGFLAMMAILQTMFDKDGMSEQKTTLYFEYLMDLSLQEIKRAVDSIISTRKYSTMPTVAEIRESALSLGDDTVSASALSAWNEANRCLLTGAKPSQATAEALRLAFGGIRGFGETEPGNEFVQKRFLDCYKSAARSERVNELMSGEEDRKSLHGVISLSSGTGS
jgi:hypothetical protein